MPQLLAVLLLLVVVMLPMAAEDQQERGTWQACVHGADGHANALVRPALRRQYSNLDQRSALCDLLGHFLMPLCCSLDGAGGFGPMPGTMPC